MIGFESRIPNPESQIPNSIPSREYRRICTECECRGPRTAVYETRDAGGALMVMERTREVTIRR